MNARRATAMFRDAVPLRRSAPLSWPRSLRWRAVSTLKLGHTRTLMPYVGALAVVLGLALVLSYAAQRVMPPLTARMGDSPVAVQVPVAEAVRPAPPAPRARTRPTGIAAAGAAIQAAIQGAVMPPAIEELRRRHLSLPVNGVHAEKLVQTFDEARGDRPHEALDIMSPRGTPVVATEDGKIAKLFFSKAGGITIYQFDPSERYVYYYAHLDRYADGLAEGQAVVRGQTIGYVGSTGNAKADAPHLHFAIFLLTPEKRWWDGTALDPYPVLRWNIDGGTP